jgi:RNA polymerase sigma-70 factor, ECF subfamily
MAIDDLATQFAEQLLAAAVLRLLPTPERLKQLEDGWARAVSTHPELKVNPEHVVREVASRLIASSEAQEAPDLSALRFEDLYLIAACGDGHPRAHALLEQKVRAVADLVLRRKLQDDELEDTVQAALAMLLLNPAKLASYSGEAPLDSWLRVVVVRVALTLQRRTPRAEALEERLAQAAPQERVDPDLALLRDQYRGALAQALTGALSELDQRTRSVMRLHLVDGVQLEDIARMYSVHRSSVSRWLALGREHLQQQTRRLLQERLRLGPVSLVSLIHLMRADDELHLRSMLGDASTDD